jgi:hypothetical protein
MLVTPSKRMHATQEHRRWRYTLKTLMFALTGVAAACACVSHWIRSFERENEIARHVELLGGTVTRSLIPCRLKWCITRIDLARGMLVPERRVADWWLLGSPDPDRSNIVSDCDLTCLSCSSSVVDLSLCGCSITDRGVAALEDLRELERLDLSSTAVSNAGTESLIRLSKVMELDLSRTRVGDAGMRRLAELTSLKVLKLNACAITDKCASDLGAIAGLAKLEVVDSKLTLRGIAEIQRLLPELEVMHDRAAYIRQHGSF